MDRAVHGTGGGLPLRRGALRRRRLHWRADGGGRRGAGRPGARRLGAQPLPGRRRPGRRADLPAAVPYVGDAQRPIDGHRRLQQLRTDAGRHGPRGDTDLRRPVHRPGLHRRGGREGQHGDHAERGLQRRAHPLAERREGGRRLRRPLRRRLGLQPVARPGRADGPPAARGLDRLHQRGGGERQPPPGERQQRRERAGIYPGYGA